MNSKPVSIYGATGFIGSRFCEMFPEIAVRQGRDENAPRCRRILYLISTTDNYNVFDDLLIDIDTNLRKLMQVLSHCKKPDIEFNFVSSWFVYGQISDLPAKESAHCEPKGFYSITKKCAEDLLISFCRTFDLRYRIFRLSNVYGERDRGVSRKRNALQYLIRKIVRNEDVELYHGGEFIRDYIHVDDACRAMRHCLDSAPLDQIINIGSGRAHRFLDLINFVRDRTDSASSIRAVEPAPFHQVVQVKDMYLDISKLLDTGFRPQISIEEGLGRAVHDSRGINPD